MLFENRSRIEGLYRAEGFYLAEVGYEVEPLGEASVSINFVVEEGKKLKLREITFSGNHAFDEYRTETLRRLEDEQREFRDFLDRLRFAKDKQEFDQFMPERRNSTDRD